MKIPIHKLSIHREYPESTIPFMRHQVGFSENKVEQCPVYEKPRKAGRLLGHEDGNCLVSKFHLCGFGETKEQAAKMAGVKL